MSLLPPVSAHFCSTTFKSSYCMTDFTKMFPPPIPVYFCSPTLISSNYITKLNKISLHCFMHFLKTPKSIRPIDFTPLITNSLHVVHVTMRYPWKKLTYKIKMRAGDKHTDLDAYQPMTPFILAISIDRRFTNVLPTPPLRKMTSSQELSPVVGASPSK